MRGIYVVIVRMIRRETGSVIRTPSMQSRHGDKTCNETQSVHAHDPKEI